MKQILHTLTLLLLAFSAFGQTSYAGFIDKYPIEFVTDIYSDGYARAIYAQYKVINNKMVLVKKRCFKWDDKIEELVERKIEDCQ